MLNFNCPCIYCIRCMHAVHVEKDLWFVFSWFAGVGFCLVSSLFVCLLHLVRVVYLWNSFVIKNSFEIFKISYWSIVLFYFVNIVVFAHFSVTQSWKKKSLKKKTSWVNDTVGCLSLSCLTLHNYTCIFFPKPKQRQWYETCLYNLWQCLESRCWKCLCF
jgi:hypothetical protein